MKTFILFLMIASMVISLKAQDTTKVQSGDQNIVTVVEDSTGTHVKIGSDSGIEVISKDKNDTLHIRIGKKVFDVIEKGNSTEIKTSGDTPMKEKHKDKFNGHWGGVELGFNIFHTTDYSIYDGLGYNDFFDINYGKSTTFNLNIAELAFSNERNILGLMTGLGFSFENFRFDKENAIIKDKSSGMVIPLPLQDPGKAKLVVSYLTVPLILEIATPLKLKSEHLTVGAGIIGGLNIGSHTKIKYPDSKDKDHSNFSLNPLKYSLTGRLGFGDLCLFANYGMSSMFKEGKGPGLKTVTVGLAFPNISF